MAPDCSASPPRGCPDCLRPTCPFCGEIGYACAHLLASRSAHVAGGWTVSPFHRGPRRPDDRDGRGLSLAHPDELRLFAELLPALAEVVRVRHVREKYLGLHQEGATYFAADPERARAQLAELLAARGVGRLP